MQSHGAMMLMMFGPNVGASETGGLMLVQLYYCWSSTKKSGRMMLLMLARSCFAEGTPAKPQSDDADDARAAAFMTTADTLICICSSGPTTVDSWTALPIADPACSVL